LAHDRFGIEGSPQLYQRNEKRESNPSVKLVQTLTQNP
jgi:hypothetical protein